MSGLSTAPKSVPLTGYGGDTLTFSITAPDALVAGRDWLGQVRATRDASEVLATFDITPPTVADGPAYVTLPGSVTHDLVANAPSLNFNGVWDVQISAAGADPITTLVQGTLTIGPDVSRVLLP